MLVVDDDPVTRQLIEAALTRWGHVPIAAEDGLRAWELLQVCGSPDVLVMGWVMNGMDGIEVCRALRAQTARAQPYVLLLAPENFRHDLVAALDAGADDYLSKPVDVSELQERLLYASRGLHARMVPLYGGLERAFNPSNDRTSVEPRAPTQSTLVGRLVGARYRVLAPVRSDSRSAIWEGYDTRNEARVAIWFTHQGQARALLAPPGDDGRAKKLSELRAEAELTVLDFGVTPGGMTYVITTFLDRWLSFPDRVCSVPPRAPSPVSSASPDETQRIAALTYVAPDYEEHDTLDTVLVSPALHDDSERTREHDCRRHAIVPLCDDLSHDLTPPPRSSDAHIDPRPTRRSARTRAASLVATVSLAGATAFGIASHRRPSEAPPPSHVTTTPRAVTLAPPAYSAAPTARPPEPVAHAEPVARAEPVALPARAAPHPTPRRTPTIAPASAPSDPMERELSKALHEQNLAHARTVLVRMIRARPRTASLYARYGALMVRMGDRYGAINAYRLAADIDFLNASYLRQLAVLQIAVGDRRGAERTLRSVLTFAPDDRETRTMLSRMAAP
jgi:CheY-like chemotaxis protein